MRNQINTPPLDDYLNLLSQPLKNLRMIVFHGASGSGKSSQIALLLGSHADLQQREISYATPATLQRTSHDVLVVDELQTLRDCRCLRAALLHSKLLLIASHVRPELLWPWRFGLSHRCYQLDAISNKLALELARREVRYSPLSLRRFVARFGANYTDLDIVLTHADVNDLDQALALFERGSTIRHAPTHETPR